ncbi:hypothetical protein AB0H34_20190 [Saccharopolyspora shandongensis]|uniref:hypothetical protein n=1 Tax=Saccharopolyspora shandongensis TaxID=418495 RepID=UPI0034091CBC
MIRRRGSRADAEALCPLVLADPDRTQSLLPVLAEHGDAAIAEQLLSACRTPALVEDCHALDTLLHVVGYLGYEPAEDLLWQQANEGFPGACLGLLHLPCHGLADEIHAEIDRHHGSAIFPEFLPALAVKAGDSELLHRLVDWGRVASTDCNGGLVLGISLFGDQGRSEFVRLLWDPAWEIDGSGTGTIRYAYAATRITGLSLTELYESVHQKANDAPEDAKHAMRVLVALLGMWASRYWVGLRMATADEDAQQLYQAFFEWSTPHHDDSLSGLAYRLFSPDNRIHDQIHTLETRVADRLTHQVETSLLAAMRR